MKLRSLAVTAPVALAALAALGVAGCAAPQHLASRTTAPSSIASPSSHASPASPASPSPVAGAPGAASVPSVTPSVSGPSVSAPSASAPSASAPSASAPSASAPSASGPSAPPALVSATQPHFDTPAAAMTYLAAAYNRDDVAALHYVTDPAAFANLMQMRSEAVNLRLDYCSPTGRGDFECYFSHDYPKSMHMKGHGASEFVAAPALRQGWYMYLFLGCG